VSANDDFAERVKLARSKPEQFTRRRILVGFHCPSPASFETEKGT